MRISHCGHKTVPETMKAQAAGVAQELRQKLTGHATAQMNAQYTHHELEALRAAVLVIPSIGGN